VNPILGAIHDQADLLHAKPPETGSTGGQSVHTVPHPDGGGYQKSAQASDQTGQRGGSRDFLQCGSDKPSGFVGSPPAT